MATISGIEPIADLRNPDPEDVDDVYKRTWGLKARVDPSVTFEEYVYWANVERAEELENDRIHQEEAGPLSIGRVLKGRFSHGEHYEERKRREREAASSPVTEGSDNEKKTGAETDLKDVNSRPQRPGAPTPEEWQIAARALRTSSWGTVFFLITTDILGWSTTP
jgi:hypothetical protein